MRLVSVPCAISLLLCRVSAGSSSEGTAGVGSQTSSVLLQGRSFSDANIGLPDCPYHRPNDWDWSQGMPTCLSCDNCYPDDCECKSPRSDRDAAVLGSRVGAKGGLGIPDCPVGGAVDWDWSQGMPPCQSCDDCYPDDCECSPPPVTKENSMTSRGLAAAHSKSGMPDCPFNWPSDWDWDLHQGFPPCLSCDDCYPDDCDCPPDQTRRETAMLRGSLASNSRLNMPDCPYTMPDDWDWTQGMPVCQTCENCYPDDCQCQPRQSAEGGPVLRAEAASNATLGMPDCPYDRPMDWDWSQGMPKCLSCVNCYPDDCDCPPRQP